MPQQVAAIFAIAENGVIGRDNDLPWRLSEDLKRFKRLTSGHPIIMGRKTYDSLGRPLPKRRNIVITRQEQFQAEGCEVVHSLEAALALCETEEEIFIIGGGSIYQEAFDKDLVDIIYQTLVHAEVDGNIFLQVPETGWKITEVESNQADEKNEFAYTYVTLVKE